MIVCEIVDNTTEQDEAESALSTWSKRQEQAGKGGWRRQAYDDCAVQPKRGEKHGHRNAGAKHNEADDDD